MTDQLAVPAKEIFVNELHQSIRGKLDPDGKWLPTDQILTILRMAGGDRRRSVHKCLLAMWYNASNAGDAEAAVAARHRITAFEDERLVV